jgi:hypothetical protein
MSGLVDWAKWMVKDQRIAGDPRSLGKDLNPVKNLERRGEELDRLFVGKPAEPTKPQAAEPTLKSAESRSPSQDLARRRKAASLYGNEPLAKKTMLGG